MEEISLEQLLEENAQLKDEVNCYRTLRKEWKKMVGDFRKENEALLKKYNDEKFIRLVLEEEKEELKEQLRLKEIIHTTFIEKNGELVEYIEIDKSDVFGGDVKKIDRIVVNVENRKVNKYISIEKVKEIVENEKCKVCDSKWHKGCRCARNRIITELDKLKGGE